MRPHQHATVHQVFSLRCYGSFNFLPHTIHCLIILETRLLSLLLTLGQLFRLLQLSLGLP